MNDYYTIISISITPLVPVIYGVVFSFIYTSGNLALSRHLSETDYKTDMMNLLRIIYIFILTFVSLLLIVRIANPVPSEGWLRTLFILTILSSESVFVYSLIRLTSTRFSLIGILLLILLFLAAVPLGLIAHTPWNYVMFISPFYWLSWAWVIPPVSESMTYALIAAVLTVVYLLIAIRFLKKRKNN